MSIPLMDTMGQWAHLKDQINSRISEIVDSGRFILGPHVSAFEKETAAYLGVDHAIGVANGTDALTIALRALGIGEGDEVICPAYTFFATPETITSVGATPVFADVDATCNITVETIRPLISGKTKAIMPVHLFGQMADMRAIRKLADEHGLKVIEDAAQAFGAQRDGLTPGQLGDCATFSFFPTKNLGGFGDGGMIVTTSQELDEQIRMLRFHGSKDKQTFHMQGYNSRLDEIQAGVLRILLAEIDSFNNSRIEVASWYAEDGLADLLTLPVVADDSRHIYHLYVARSDEREAHMEALTDANIGTAIYYGKPHHLQPVYAGLGYGAGDLPVTEGFSRDAFCLPMFPTMTREQAREVATTIKQAASVAPQ